MDQENANSPSYVAQSFERFPPLGSFRFDDLGVPGKLALIADSGAWAWVQPNFATRLEDGVVRVELLAVSGTETFGIPCDVYNIVEAYFRLDFPISNDDERQRQRTMKKAETAFQRFLDGEHRPFSRLASTGRTSVPADRSNDTQKRRTA